MRLRERVLEGVRARAEGEVRFDGEGRSNYCPPGTTVRKVGDLLAGLGTLGLVIPLITPRLGYPAVLSRLDPVLQLAVWTVVPFAGAMTVWFCITRRGWEPRLVVLLIGLLGTALTWQWAAEVIGFWAFGGRPPRDFELAWLGQGSLLVLAGGLLGLPAALFGEWAKRYDATHAESEGEGESEGESGIEG